MVSGLLPGVLVGQYCLEESIGDGAFASVWRAHPVHYPDVPVAIKVISKSQIQTTQAKTRLTREISLLRKMQHPFISEFFQMTEDDAHFYLVMEYVSHGHLLDYVNNHGCLSEEQARRYFTQLLWVLEYLHLDQRIAHRDLKCENVLLDSYDNIRVIDFGLSSQFTEVHPELKTACGSPAYAAPEMIRGNLYTRAADIWSAGILLFAIIAGELPFDDENVARLLQKIVFTEPRFPNHMSPPLVDLLQKMLCKDPELRIDLPGIISHPWFSQQEYTVMQELVRESVQGGSGESEIDPGIIQLMIEQGLNCHGLHESLLTGAETELTVIYRILSRKKVTENLRGQMKRISQGMVKSKVAAGRHTMMTSMGGGGSGGTVVPQAKLPVLSAGRGPRPVSPGPVGERGSSRLLGVPIAVAGRKMLRLMAIGGR